MSLICDSVAGVIQQNSINVFSTEKKSQIHPRSRGGGSKSNRGRFSRRGETPLRPTRPDDKYSPIRHCQNTAARNWMRCRLTESFVILDGFRTGRGYDEKRPPRSQSKRPSPAERSEGEVYRKLHKLRTDKYKCPLCTVSGYPLLCLVSLCSVGSNELFRKNRGGLTYLNKKILKTNMEWLIS